MPSVLHVLRLEVLGALHVPVPGEARGAVRACWCMGVFVLRVVGPLFCATPRSPRAR